MSRLTAGAGGMTAGMHGSGKTMTIVIGNVNASGIKETAVAVTMTDMPSQLLHCHWLPWMIDSSNC